MNSLRSIGKKRLAILLILLIALPLLLIVTKQRQDQRSSAAAPDKLEAEGGVLAGNAKIQSDTNASGGNYVLFQPNIKSVTVTSIAGLKTSLADNSIDEIVVANGTYHVSAAANQASDSLWIGAQFAPRTRPITVRAQTRGGVTFDGGGTTYFGCISFEDGVHDQTWDGFNCAGGEATDTGIITFGGYAGKVAPHHITMRFISILPTCTGNSLNASSPATDHAFYISQAIGGPHDLLFEDITVDGAGFLASAFHFYHSDATNQNGWNVMVRRLHVKGTQQAIILWDPTLKNITFDTADIVNPIRFAVRYETTGSTNILLQNITSDKDFYSSQGNNPAGITFINNTFNSPINTPTPTLISSTPPCPSNLQTAINNVTSGAVLDVTGCGPFSGTFNIAKAMTLKGAKINAPANGAGITISADNVTVINAAVTGAQAAVFKSPEKCVAIVGSSSNTVDNVTVKDSTISRCGYGGVYAYYAKSATISNNSISDSVYSGILLASVSNSTVSNNTIRRTGVYGGSTNGWNAYGITATQLIGGVASSDIVIQNNIIDTVPTWHGLDTHGGIRISYLNNTIRGARRGIFLTSSPTDSITNGNDITAPTASQISACQGINDGRNTAFCSDIRGISIYGGSGSITNNVGHNYPSGSWWNPISAGDYSFSGNAPSIP